MDSSQGFEANRSCFPMMNKQAQDKIPSAHGHNSHQVYSSTMQKRKEDPSIPNLNRTSSQTNGISPQPSYYFNLPCFPLVHLPKGLWSLHNRKHPCLPSLVIHVNPEPTSNGLWGSAAGRFSFANPARLELASVFHL